MKISDYIANFLIEKNIDLVFTITGSGNIRLIESVSNAGIKYIVRTMSKLQSWLRYRVFVSVVDRLYA